MVVSTKVSCWCTYLPSSEVMMCDGWLLWSCLFVIGAVVAAFAATVVVVVVVAVVVLVVVAVVVVVVVVAVVDIDVGVGVVVAGVVG